MQLDILVPFILITDRGRHTTRYLVIHSNGLITSNIYGSNTFRLTRLETDEFTQNIFSGIEIKEQEIRVRYSKSKNAIRFYFVDGNLYVGNNLGASIDDEEKIKQINKWLQRLKNKAQKKTFKSVR